MKIYIAYKHPELHCPQLYVMETLPCLLTIYFCQQARPLLTRAGPIYFWYYRIVLRLENNEPKSKNVAFGAEKSNRYYKIC